MRKVMEFGPVVGAALGVLALGSGPAAADTTLTIVSWGANHLARKERRERRR